MQDESEERRSPLRRTTVTRLREEVAAMNLNNFIVRPKRRLIEKYTHPAAWIKLDTAEQAELAVDVAGLPSELEDADQEAKLFDLIVLRLQLAVLTHDYSFKRLRDQVHRSPVSSKRTAAFP